MKNDFKFVHITCSLICMSNVVFGTEFTFDLAKNGEECFYEYINQNIMCEFEFQVSFRMKKKGLKIDQRSLFLNLKVVSGTSALDVDVYIESPSRKTIYKQIRKEDDRFKFNTTVSIQIYINEKSGRNFICRK